jgi:hypothetical protein
MTADDDSAGVPLKRGERIAHRAKAKRYRISAVPLACRNSKAGWRSTQCEPISPHRRKSMRLVLLFAILYSFTVFAFDGSGIDPHGGGVRLTSDQGSGTDPNGIPRRAVIVHSDGAGGSDPNG